MIISHKIELEANNKEKTHFRKAFGCARFAYNWGLAKWKDNYEKGKKTNCLELKKEFNSIKKKDFSYAYEVSKYATQQPFLNLDKAIKKFFTDLNKGRVSYPQFKKKRIGSGSYYVGGDQVKLINKDGRSYFNVPKLGPVKMREKLRFNGKILSAAISQHGDSFFASFCVEIDGEEYKRTHSFSEKSNDVVGIDAGLKSFATLSSGIAVHAPKPLKKLERRLKRACRQLSRKQHPKTKGDTTKKSANYVKQALRISRIYSRISNIRNDFLHKLTSLLTRHYGIICVEDLNVSGMMKNHRLAKAISDVSFYEFKRLIEYKSEYRGGTVIKADRFYPSSKTCCLCGTVKSDLRLSDRIYRCNECRNVIDRDLNAAVNLVSYATNKIGLVQAELTPVDLTALLDDLAMNHLATSKVEAGMQQKACL